MEDDARMDELKVADREKGAGSPSSVHPVNLNLRKLEDIQKLFQYGAVVVFLVFVGLIAFSYFQTRKITRLIAEQRGTLANQKIEIERQREEMKQNQEKIDAQKAVLDSFANAIRESPTASNTQGAQEQRQIELSIPKDVNARQVPARVYFQIGREDQRRHAAAVARQLQDNGYLVPGIENVGPKASGQTELRFCTSDEAAKQDLDQITNLLIKLSIKVKQQPISNCRNVRPRHYEVWFGDDF
jgi:hypothetical protein